MEYNFRDIEKKWQQQWNDAKAYEVSNPDGHRDAKPKYYVLDMFPYPSGAGLHVGHPLGYIASDIYSRYKRLKGYNVLHPMGYDAFGLPAEQYAIEHGVHPADSTAQNIDNFRRQLDNIGFSYDWSREVKTSDPYYYRWTQWIFLQLFKSWYNRKTNKAENIDGLINLFQTEGNINMPCPGDSAVFFTADEWNNYEEKEQQDVLMQYRLAYCGEGEVNWCEALGTVLANDEVVNGVSERGGYPVVKKKLRQWYLRITEYAGRLQADLDKLEWTDAMKEMQTNWIGKSYGAEITFEVNTPHPQPLSSQRGEQLANESAGTSNFEELSGKHFQSADNSSWSILKEYGRENRKNQTEAENILWEELRNSKLGQKVRRQHNINGYIADFAFMESHLVIEVDGGYHNEEEQKTYDAARTSLLEENGFTVIRFTNEEVLNDLKNTLQTIKTSLTSKKTGLKNAPLSQPKQQISREVNQSATNSEETRIPSQKEQQSSTEAPLSGKRGAGGEASTMTVYTTRPDTIMGVDFMVVAPELDWINEIKSAEQATAVDEYIAYVASRSERERQAEKKITGCFTGAYAVNPFNGREIPIWISEYVLAGYGTGAIMAVPCGDERDFKFAQHFNIPITNIIGDAFNGEEANPTKEAVLSNSGFLDGTPMRQAMEVVPQELEKRGIGRRKTNYRMRDAAFSRQRYWGEPFPIIWKDGIAYPLSEAELPLELPYMENIKPGSNGEGPLANNLEWSATPILAREPELEGLEKGDKELGIRETNTMPGYAGSSWYFLRYMDPHNTETFADRKVTDYWNQVDVYIGGTEHAVGHLLYSRMWTKALFDLGHIGFDEPFKKLVNQGMIQGNSRFVYRLNYRTSNVNIFIPKSILEVCFSKMSTKDILKFEVDDQFSPFFKISLSNDKLIITKADEIIWKYIVEGEQKLIKWFQGIILSGKDYKTEEQYPSIFFSSSILPYSFGFANDANDTLFKPINFDEIHVDVNIVDGYELDIEAFKKWRNGEHANAEFILEDSTGAPLSGRRGAGGEATGKYICGSEIEKMSKSKFNTVNPDELVIKYGADTFRMYEMFLGPIEQSKPWDTKGIEGVHRFLKKLWRLFFDEVKGTIWNEEKPTDAELKILHRTIKKIEDDTERFSFNTAVSAFMVCVNELGEIKCHKKAILEPLLIMLTPYAPHIAEELFQQLQSGSNAGNYSSVLDATFPTFEEKYIAESVKEYPISINGKLRTTLIFPLDAEQSFIEKEVMANEVVQKWTEGKQPKKIIYVRGRMINVVV